MRGFSFWDEIPIPPREEEGVRLSLEDGRVAARFTLGDDDRIKPVSIRHPSLKPLARAVRPDGSVPAEKALAFLEQFESGGLSSGARVEIDSSVYLLTKDISDGYDPDKLRCFSNSADLAFLIEIGLTTFLLVNIKSPVFVHLKAKTGIAAVGQTLLCVDFHSTVDFLG